MRNRLSIAWVLAVSLALALSTGACANNQAAPVSHPSPDIAVQIDAIVHGALAHQHLVGLSVAVAHNGKVLYARGFGYRNLAQRLPATPQTIYNIASMSKQFTAACIMLLAQDGKLNVDDPLSKYLPHLPGAGRLTLRNLLNHTSGLVDYLDILDVNSLSMSKIIAALENTRLRYAPGARFEYSNSNYVLLGAVVSKVSGMPFDRFLTDRIFKPLQLRFTSIGTAPIDMTNGSLGYTVVDGKPKLTPPQTVSVLDFPDGGVNSTVLDLLKWDAALDSGRVVNKGGLGMMFAPGPHGREVTFGYGFGLRIKDVYGHTEICHTGGWTGYTGENATFPDDRLAIVMLSNTDTLNKEYLVRKIFALFYPPNPEQRAVEAASAAGENRTITPKAALLLAQLTSGQVDADKLSPDLRKRMTRASISALQRSLAAYGKLQRMVFADRDADTSGVYEDYRLFYPSAVVSYSLRFDSDGRAAEIGLSRED